MPTENCRKLDEPAEAAEVERSPRRAKSDKEEAVTDLRHHVAVGRAFILNRFDRVDAYWDFGGCKHYYDRILRKRRCIEIWDSLAHTEWQDDDEVRGKALSCGLPLSKLLEKSPVLVHHVTSARPIIIELFQSKISVERCTEMWNSLAGTKWQDDAEICSAALSCGLPPSKLEGKSILKSSQAIEYIFQDLKHTHQAIELWDMLDPEIQQNRDVVFTVTGCALPFDKVHKTLQDTHQLRNGLLNGTLNWEQLPEEHRHDVELGLCALDPKHKRRGTSTPEFGYVLDQVTNKTKLFLEWACTHPERTRDDPGIWEFAPSELLSDCKLMLKVISKASWIIPYIDSSLLNNEEFLKKAFNVNPLVFGDMEPEVFERFPSFLSLKRLRIYQAKYHHHKYYWKQHLNEEFIDNVPPSFWKDHRFLLHTWIKAGGNLHRQVPCEFFDDHEVLLAHAKQYFLGWRDGVESMIIVPSDDPYRRLSARLKGDKSFVQKMLRLVPPSYIIPKSSFQDDYVLQTFASFIDAGYRPFSSNPRGAQGPKFRNALRQQLREYSGFLTLLCCIAKSPSSTLVALGQRIDANIKACIASYLDFPKGKSLTHLEKAASNLHLSPDDEDEPLPRQRHRQRRREVDYYSDSDYY